MLNALAPRGAAGVRVLVVVVGGGQASGGPSRFG